jgi:hypothetical protein
VPSWHVLGLTLPSSFIFWYISLKCWILMYRQHIGGGIQNIPDWCHSSCCRAKHQ